MKRPVLLALLAALVAAAFATAGTNAQTPDIEELVARIDAEHLRAHIDAIDEPRNAFAQPERLSAAADYVQSQLESFGYDVTLDDVTYRTATFPNVFGEQRGTSCPDRTFVVGGHYDSVALSPGADDDASGTSAMLEIARALADTPLPATVRFAGFTMEEDGLIGSRKMAADLAAQDAQVVGMMSLEMLGYTAGAGNDFLAVLGNTASIRLTDAVHRASETYVPGLPAVVLNLVDNGEEQPDSRRSDHAPFWDAGYQALLVTDTANFRNPNYHQPSDTIDTLDFDFMTNSTRAMLATTVDYLTYDANGDGQADACSGPLAATPTVTGTPPSSGPFPIVTVTPTAQPALPPTGDRPVNKHGWPNIWAWLAIGGAVLIGSASVALRLRR